MPPAADRRLRERSVVGQRPAGRRSPPHRAAVGSSPLAWRVRWVFSARGGSDPGSAREDRMAVAIRTVAEDAARAGAAPTQTPLESAAAAGLRYVSDDAAGHPPRSAPAGTSATSTPTASRSATPTALRAHPRAGHPAGLDRRVDLPVAQRPPPGHRPRCAGPQAVPLSPALARGARRDEVRAACSPSARRCRGSARRRRARPGAAGPAAGEGAGDGRAAAGDDADPRRQRGVRAARTARSA